MELLPPVIPVRELLSVILCMASRTSELLSVILCMASRTRML